MKTDVKPRRIKIKVGVGYPCKSGTTALTFNYLGVPATMTFYD